MGADGLRDRWPRGRAVRSPLAEEVERLSGGPSPSGGSRGRAGRPSGASSGRAGRMPLPGGVHKVGSVAAFLAFARFP
jgi:hypothetical protein